MNMFVKFFCDIGTMIWCWWSQFRHRDAQSEYELLPEDKIATIADARMITRRIYSNFTYTSDDITELYDSMVPPAQCYKDYAEGKLSDDCDGFHSAVYHCLQMNGIESYLLTANARGAGHCICIFKLNNNWHVCDYTTIYKGYATLVDAIEAYDNIFPSIYNAKGDKVYYNALVEYNYKEKRFKFKEIKNVE